MSQELELLARGVMQKLDINTMNDLSEREQSARIRTALKILSSETLNRLAKHAPADYWRRGQPPGGSGFLEMAEFVVIERIREILSN